MRLNRMGIPPELRKLALERDGIITAAQAREHKVSRGMVARRIAAGDWVDEGHRIYRLVDHPATARTRTRIATLSVSPSAVLGGVMAAWWHGVISRRPTSATVTAPLGWHGSAVAGVTVVRRPLLDVDVVERDGLRVTALSLTVLEAAVEGGMDVVDRALQKHLVTVDDMMSTYGRHTTGKNAAQMARILELLGPNAHSEAERLAVAVFTEHEIVGWEANYQAAGYELDFAFPAQKVAVEIDGMAYHTDAATFQRDRKRRNALINAGWTVLNFTWSDLLERPGYVAAQIRYALAHAAA